MDGKQSLKKPARSKTKSPLILVLTLIMAMLAACATPPVRAPVSKPAPVQTPVPVVKPVAPVVVVPPPVTTGLVDPGSFEKEKSRLKSALSKSSRDSLPVKEVGYYMDVLHGRLKQITGKSPGAGIGRKGNVIVVILSGSSAFESGNNQITPGIRNLLAPLSSVLVEYRMMLVTVRVRAEGAAGKTQNPMLTEQRTLAVTRYLTDAGISNKRLLAIGPDPAAKAGNAPGRERIEIRLEPVIQAVNN